MKRKNDDIREVVLSTGEKRYKATYSYGSGSTRRRKTKTFSGLKEAERWLLALSQDENKGVTYWAENKPLDDLYLEFVTRIKRPFVRPSTEKNFMVNYHRIQRVFGKATAGSLNRLKVQKALNEMGKTLSQQSMTQFRFQLNQLYQELVYSGGLAVNPIEGTKAKSTKIMSKKEKVFTITNYKKLIRYLYSVPFKEDGMFEQVSLVAAVGGMRLSEILALTDSDIDEVNSVIRIDESYDHINHKNSKTKTRAGVRNVPVPMKLIRHIRWWQVEQRKALFKKGIRNPNGLLFLRADGTTPPISTIDYHFKRILQEAQIDQKLSPHELRHSMVSFLLSSDNGKTPLPIEYVSEIIGHSNVSTTNAIYRHLLQEDRQRYTEESRKRLSGL